MNIAFAVFLAGIGAALLWLIWFFLFRPWAQRQERERPRFIKDGQGVEREQGVGARICPACGQRLAVGMSIKSRLYPSKTPERIMHIFGCPYCWPENGEHKRACPVCEKVVPRGGFLIARYFEQPGHRHVHVLGCSGCRYG